MSSLPAQQSGAWWRDPALRRNAGTASILYLGSFSLGYDGSYLNGLQSLVTWNSYFGNPTGLNLSIIGAMPYIFMAATAPFYGVLCDKLGRKMAIYLACLLILIGAAVGAAAQNRAMFLAGRAIAGPGGSLILFSSNLLCNEILHPRIRAVGAGLVLSFFYVGAAVSAWISFGVVAGEWSSDWAWRLPTLCQAIGPLVMCGGMLIVPESPRWHIAKGRPDKAREILTAQHANGVQNDPFVDFELEEISAAIVRERALKINFSSLFKTKGNRRRLLILCVCGLGAQMNGIGLFSYYLAPVLGTVGVDKPLQQTAINACLTLWNLGFAVLGAALSDRAGRRKLWLTSSGGLLVCFVCLITLSGLFAERNNTNAGLASVAFIFLAFAFYSLAWTPLSYSYATEILPYSMRASGFALFSFLGYAGIIFGQWVNPVGLETAGWKFYFLYLAILTVIVVVQYFTFVETRGLTLEEVTQVFDKYDSGTSSDVDEIPVETLRHDKRDHEAIHIDESDQK